MHKPAGPRWANAELVRVHLTTEAPAIGTGVRHVWAAIGRKWVHLVAANGRKARMTIATFTTVRKP